MATDIVFYSVSGNGPRGPPLFFKSTLFPRIRVPYWKPFSSGNAKICHPII